MPRSRMGALRISQVRLSLSGWLRRYDGDDLGESFSGLGLIRVEGLGLRAGDLGFKGNPEVSVEGFRWVRSSVALVLKIHKLGELISENMTCSASATRLPKT